MCEWGSYVDIEVTIDAAHSHTGEEHQAVKPIDACIAPIVAALNQAGILTGRSCCGHGKTDGWIVLADGRKLTITENDRRDCVGIARFERYMMAVEDLVLPGETEE